MSSPLLSFVAADGKPPLLSREDIELALRSAQLQDAMLSCPKCRGIYLVVMFGRGTLGFSCAKCSAEVIFGIYIPPGPKPEEVAKRDTESKALAAQALAQALADARKPESAP